VSETVRFGVSLGLDLLDRFDRLIKDLGYGNRSEAVRDLIRQKLVAAEWETPDAETFASVSVVYDHHLGKVLERLNSLQHDSYAQVISTLHVHIDHDNCLEVIVLKGKASELRDLAEQMIALKGVKYGDITMGTTGAHVS
jgi:CopG family nickel-responsive transcriptional regulator